MKSIAQRTNVPTSPEICQNMENFEKDFLQLCTTGYISSSQLDELSKKYNLNYKLSISITPISGGGIRSVGCMIKNYKEILTNAIAFNSFKEIAAEKSMFKYVVEHLEEYKCAITRALEIFPECSFSQKYIQFINNSFLKLKEEHIKFDEFIAEYTKLYVEGGYKLSDPYFAKHILNMHKTVLKERNSEIGRRILKNLGNPALLIQDYNFRNPNNLIVLDSN